MFDRNKYQCGHHEQSASWTTSKEDRPTKSTVSKRVEEHHGMKWRKYHGTLGHQNRQPWPWLWPSDNSMWLHGRIDRRPWIRFEGLRWEIPWEPNVANYFSNVRPCVARRTPWRDKPIIGIFEVSPSQVYRYIVGKGLFHSYFSS